jgi:hypothetical protein
LWVALSLAHPSALGPCPTDRITNRHVRPILRALTRIGAQAHYFGRDWVSVAHRPAAWIGFAHDAGTRRTLVEAFLAVRTPFAIAPRPSFLGKEPGTLESILGRAFALESLEEAIVKELSAGDARVAPEPAPEEREDDPRADPPWTATIEEAIGEIGAGPDRSGALSVGGDLLVSRDALASLNRALPSLADSDVGAAVDGALRSPGVALEGVKSLVSVRDVILRAKR